MCIETFRQSFVRYNTCEPLISDLQFAKYSGFSIMYVDVGLIDIESVQSYLTIEPHAMRIKNSLLERY